MTEMYDVKKNVFICRYRSHKIFVVINTKSKMLIL